MNIIEAAHRICWRYKHSKDPAHSSTYTFNDKTLEQFAALVRAEALEEAAKLCEDIGEEPDDHKSYEGYDEGYQDGGNNCAAAIRGLK